MIDRPLGWLGIVRLGLVQTALGAVVVLGTSTMNRVMVVELMLPAALPGALVAWHYAVQMLRPRLGFGSDVQARRTPWIVGGMAVLAIGGLLGAVATALMATDRTAGMLLAVLAFMMIGLGVGAAGTTLLVLLAKRVEEKRRAAAATIVWVMMIAGFALTAGLAGGFLEPFTMGRLVSVTAVVCGAAFVVSLLAVWGVEGRPSPAEEKASQDRPAERPRFSQALREVWAEPEARRFSIFVFVSMLAYSAQDLILEPYAGLVFGYSPGQSTSLAGVQHGGVLLGMIAVALAGSLGRGRFGSLRAWTIGGCIGSAFALALLPVGGMVGETYPLRLSVFALGAANGAFAVAAIGSMMALAGKGRERREGVRMGLWGAAQAVAFGLGGFAGAAAADLVRLVAGSPLAAYGSVFAAEALMFLVAAALAAGITTSRPRSAAGATATSMTGTAMAGAGGARA